MQTIGERLEEARKRKGISIREASEATKIRSDYLQKFETNSYELNLPDIYVRGFLRTYAQYLKLNTEKLLTDYAALGHGDPRDTRRQDQREIFGRIDLPDPGKAAPPPAPPPEGHTPRNQPPQSRAVPTSVVTGAPSADRAQKYKAGLILGVGGVALVLLVLLIRAVLPSSAPSGPEATAAAQPTAIPSENLMRLIAIDNVRVKVTQKSDNRVLFDGDLLKGDTRAIERNGTVYVTYDIGKNLQVEIRGQRFRMSVDGYGRNKLD